MRSLPHFRSKAFFAPMAGVSDPALRLICRELGAGLVVTEFVNVHAIIAKEKQLNDITKFVEFSKKEKPLSIQLFGSDLEMLKKAVKIVEPYFDIIDYNMGCPAPHITQQMACSALLQELELTKEILTALVQTSKKPISIKIRSGISKPDKWEKIAQIADEAGVSMITFHPRTVKQGYGGKSDWSLIKKLKEKTKMIVVGNGDINTPEDTKKMLDETGCDYVMVGRAAAKNPFLFQQINDYLKTGAYQTNSTEEILDVFFRYLKYSKRYRSINFSRIKFQAMNFTRGCEGSRKLRMEIGKTNDLKELVKVLKEFRKKVKKSFS